MKIAARRSLQIGRLPLIGFFGVASVLLFAAAASHADDPQGDAHHWLYLGPRRPVLIRLHIQTAGVPGGEAFSAAQATYIDRLFGYLDRDDNGRLDEAEARCAPPPQLQLAGGNMLDPAEVHFAFNFRALDIDSDGGIVPSELAAYLTAYSDGFLRLVRAPGGEAARTADFESRLDTDDDGALSVDELRQSEKLLATLDANDDELLSAQELARTGTKNSFVAAPTEDGGPVKSGRLVWVQSARRTADQLLAAYGDRTTKTRGLDEDDIKLDRSAFDRLDADDDGWLDRSELGGFVRLPADVELNVVLDAVAGEPSLIVLRPVDGEDGPFSVSNATADAYTFKLDGNQLRIAVTGGGMDVDACCQALAEELWQCDANEDGLLAAQEMEGSLLYGALSILGVAGTDSMGAAEVERFLNSFLRPYLEVSARRVAYWVGPPGEGLFDLLDRDGDRHLNLSEIRDAASVTERCDANGDGRLQHEEITQCQVLSIASMQAGPPQAVIDAVLPPETFDLLENGATRWFVKMDRNRDGYVSPREFLGAAHDFALLDSDTDQLIDRAEARAESSR